MYIATDGIGYYHTESWKYLIDAVIGWYQYLIEEPEYQDLEYIPHPYCIEDLYDREPDIDKLAHRIRAWEDDIIELATYRTFDENGNLVGATNRRLLVSAGRVI